LPGVESESARLQQRWQTSASAELKGASAPATDPAPASPTLLNTSPSPPLTPLTPLTTCQSQSQSSDDDEAEGPNTVKATAGTEAPPAPGDDCYQLRARCDTLVREREAVQTIMEQKIKVLVQRVSSALDAVLREDHRHVHAVALVSGPGPGPGPGLETRAGSLASEAREALCRDVSSLQRLVDASILALRNAAAAAAAATQQ
jgi:hypothetical protein